MPSGLQSSLPKRAERDESCLAILTICMPRGEYTNHALFQNTTACSDVVRYVACAEPVQYHRAYYLLIYNTGSVDILLIYDIN